MNAAQEKIFEGGGGGGGAGRPPKRVVLWAFFFPGAGVLLRHFGSRDMAG
ncbi:MAG: hypothetical protein IPK98_17815 [Chloracidobacterium sp.]|nr:hypothetical protein [Chloracidobacterium sp.]